MTQIASASPIAPPEPLQFSADEREEIVNTCYDLYRRGIQNRTQWNDDHLLYNRMFRGQVEDRAGPWPDSSNLHVQMPYWLVDAINTRMVNGVWAQTPLVSGSAEEDDDQEIFRNAAKLIDWHLQPKRMSARSLWNRVSKMRCIHGVGVGLISYARDKYSFRQVKKMGAPAPMMNPDGTFQLDENGQPILNQEIETEIREGTKYDGPVFHPLDYDDVVAPLDSMNLQPNRPSNPGGSDWVHVRQYENLSLIWKKRDSAYNYIDDSEEWKDRENWVDAAPSQDRASVMATGDNSRRSRQDIAEEGRNRDPLRKDGRKNPEFEVVTSFIPWEVEDENGDVEERECVLFWSIKPRVLLGGFLLSDIHWQEDRPLLEMHYQTVGTRFYSMGVMEIAKHLSAELDTIHNLRMDVGFATNMPFFFFRASSAFDPEKIIIRPLKGVPVDDINDVHFPQLQNVTTFYHQEEQLLYTLVERVLGVTDLFLGMSPTSGAAARHATGFVGTQQESLARTSEILNGDAEAFSFLCRTIYNFELQYGPDERILRLQGKEGALTEQRLTRQDLWLRGEYDFRLGSNQGAYSTMLKQEQSQALMQLRGQSQLINTDPGRSWETESFFLHSAGFENPEVFIGPKDAVAQSSPESAEEENGEMDQYKHGFNQPSPVHPSDNDDQHLQKHNEHTNSEAYISMGRPNYTGFLQHQQSHVQQQQQKQMQQQQQQMMMQQQQQPQNGNGQADNGNRAISQLMNVDSMGAMGDIGQAPTGTPPPPNFGGPNG